MWRIFFPPETDCTTLFSQSRNSGSSNDFPSPDDEDVRTEGLLSEPFTRRFGSPPRLCAGLGKHLIHGHPVMLQSHQGFPHGDARSPDAVQTV